MKCTLLGFASIMLLCLPRTTTAQQASEYFPLQVGNYWIQQTDSVGGVDSSFTYRKEVEGIDSIGSGEYYRVRESLGVTGGGDDSE